jgi:hypothetical protein
MYNIIFHIWWMCVSKLYICGNLLKTVFSPCVPARRFESAKLGGSVFIKKMGFKPVYIVYILFRSKG